MGVIHHHNRRLCVLSAGACLQQVVGDNDGGGGEPRTTDDSAPCRCGAAATARRQQAAPPWHPGLSKPLASRLGEPHRRRRPAPIGFSSKQPGRRRPLVPSPPLPSVQPALQALRVALERQEVLEPVTERVERGRDDVRVHAHSRPALRQARELVVPLELDHHARGGGRGLGPLVVQDAHLVVREPHLAQQGEGRLQPPAQRLPQRVHGAVALRHLQQRAPALALGPVRDLHLHRRARLPAGQEAGRRRRRRPALGDGVRGGHLVRDLAAVVHDVEGRRVVLHHAPQHQLHRGLGALEGVAHLLQYLDVVQDLQAAVGPGGALLVGDAQPELLHLGDDVAAAGQVRDQDAACVAHHIRVHVLVGGRVLGHGGHVDAALVREGRGADPGLASRGYAVHHLVHEPAEAGQLAQLGPAHARVAHLQLQRGHQRGQVGVARALAHAVDRALHQRAARAQRGQRVGHGQLLVVVAVDAQPHAGELRRHPPHARLDLPGQPAAIRVAQHQHVHAGVHGRAAHVQRARRVGGHAVEEVLQVQHDLAAGGLQVGDAVRHHRQVLLAGHLEDLVDVQVPALAHNADAARLALQQHGDLLVLLDGKELAARAAEGNHPAPGGQGQLGPRPRKEFRVLGVGAGPAALDVGHPELAQPLGDGQLAVHRHTHAFSLGSIPQSCVVDVHMLRTQPIRHVTGPLG
mmetsp:Transcript_7714/g.14504  ORF Transcript_7714/g.14504 Transcript_7714/m.14504 type:complete len:690 (+) Transcript_7714:205-2274(+)